MASRETELAREKDLQTLTRLLDLAEVGARRFKQAPRGSGEWTRLYETLWSALQSAMTTCLHLESLREAAGDRYATQLRERLTVVLTEYEAISGVVIDSEGKFLDRL